MDRRLLEPKIENFWSKHQSRLFIVAGILLIVTGAILYAMSQSILIPLASVLLIFGIIFFLQSSPGFRVTQPLVFIVVLILATGLVLFIDFWPLQFFYGQAAASLLQLTGVNPILQSVPHFGGLQILLHTQDAHNGMLVGGEIDNACAGLIVFIPILFLLVFSKNGKYAYKNRVILCFISIILVFFGNLFRIFFELWLPAVGVIPFILVHYPFALFLGLIGLGTIVVIGFYLQYETRQIPDTKVRNTKC